MGIQLSAVVHLLSSKLPPSQISPARADSRKPSDHREQKQPLAPIEYPHSARCHRPRPSRCSIFDPAAISSKLLCRLLTISPSLAHNPSMRLSMPSPRLRHACAAENSASIADRLLIGHARPTYEMLKFEAKSDEVSDRHIAVVVKVPSCHVADPQLIKCDARSMKSLIVTDHQVQSRRSRWADENTD